MVAREISQFQQKFHANRVLAVVILVRLIMLILNKGDLVGAKAEKCGGCKGRGSQVFSQVPLFNCSTFIFISHHEHECMQGFLSFEQTCSKCQGFKTFF